MEPNEEMNITVSNPEVPEAEHPENPEAQLPEGRYNLEICPNCLEANDEDLAVCKYCGQPLTPGSEVIDSTAMPESEKELAANRAAAEQANKPKKKQESGFRRVMPWLGLYLIYYAFTGVIETAHTEELKDVKLAYLSWVIWFAAGILMSLPLWKKWYRKLRHLPEEDETEEAAPETAENTEAEAGEAADETEADELPAADEAAELSEENTEEAADPEAEPAAEPDVKAESGDADESGKQEEDETGAA